MNIDALRFYRNLFFKILAVCFVLNVLAAAATFALWDTWTGLTASWFHSTPEAIGPAVLNFFMYAKFYMIYVLLAPALALHWAVKEKEKQTKS